MQVKIIADSISPSGVRLTTMQLKYQRFFHSEVMTHRVFSRNASSSRAIPVAKVLEQVRNDPATPVEWGKNQAGMQARENFTSLDDVHKCQTLWLDAATQVAGIAEEMARFGLHKQIVNRILEPFQYIHVVVTSTEWDNFFALRDHPDAQPEIRELAKLMKEAYNASKPKKLLIGQWHLPYITEDDRHLPINDQKKVSAARCCRVSYVKHDGFRAEVQEDIILHDKLVTANPPHMSPVEHQAQCSEGDEWSGNFKQWKQYRKEIEHIHYFKDAYVR